jgi:hypothetical protein
MGECCNEQTFLIHIVHFLDKIIQINSFHNLCIISNHMYLDAHLPAKTCEDPRCVCPFYRPAHHTKWLQLLTPTLNIASCHMYVSTVIPADIQCYITQWYHYTPEWISWIETRFYACIIPKLLVIFWPRTTNLIS